MNEILHAEASAEMLKLDQNCKKTPSVAVLKKIFKSLLKTNTLKPELVAKYGWKVISNSNEMEIWIILEQVYVAAITVGDHELADKCLNKLVQQFPNSVTVKRLIAMGYEAKGELAKASETYKAILEEAPGDVATMKRQVCIYKSQNDIPNAIKSLITLVQQTTAMNESSCWIELADLYCENCDYEEALYCMEECVLIDPYNCHVHNRVADLYYTLGGMKNLLKARKHYTMSLNYQSPNPKSSTMHGNTRGLLGLLYTCQLLIECGIENNTSSSSSSHQNNVKAIEIESENDEKSMEEEMKMTNALYTWCQEQLKVIEGQKLNDFSKSILENLKDFM